MSLVFDAGALVAIERSDRETIALLKFELIAGRAPRTHGGVVAQVWRGGSGRQANLARLLPAFEIVPIDDAFGRRIGNLLSRARKADVIDAAVVLLASDGDFILTSDPDDLSTLAKSTGIHVDIALV
jgi:hypothetical protein